VVVWLPFFLYLAIGVIDAYRAGNDETNPALAPNHLSSFTDKGIKVTNPGKIAVDTKLEPDLPHGQRVARTYVFTLQERPYAGYSTIRRGCTRTDSQVQGDIEQTHQNSDKSTF
jgi:hypothetical protein